MQIKDVLIQFGLHKTLKGRPNSGTSKELSSDGGPRESNNGSSEGSKKFSMSDEDWEEIDLRAANAMSLNLAKNALANVHRISTAKRL